MQNCKKRIAVFLVSLLVCVMSLVPVLANAPELDPVQPPAKPVVATIYINNAKSTYDDEITQKVTDRFNAKLVNYQIVPGAKYVEKLNKMGITDITTAERSDIIQAFAGDNVDYLVYAEVPPPILKSWQSFFNIGVNATVTLPVKILDLKNNKYLYNGKFTESADNSSVIGGVGTKAAVMKALDQILVKTDEVLITRMPLK